MQFDETPKVDFEVKDENGEVVYRDSITYPSMADLRADSKEEREAKFQERYENWLTVSTTPTEEVIPPEEV